METQEEDFKTKKFIEKARVIHGDKYDYSNVIYKHSKLNVSIICPEHGDFQQTPNRHLKGSGCSRCTNAYKYDTKEFINKAILIHNNNQNYDYSKTNYINNISKVTIICKKHGEFYQTPFSHLQGQGCSLCAKEKNTSNTIEFIAKAKKIHNNKYDYSKVDYERSDQKVTIICPEHGDFQQTPHGHLKGSGCSICGIKRYTLTTDIFIKRSKEIHNNKYNYSKTNYINSLNKVTITCKHHGDFNQRPLDHLKGSGCPQCQESIGEKLITNVLTDENIKFIREFKLPNYRLFYDFYLPDYNLLIEFHGIQHYDYVPFFHRNGEEDLLKQQERDVFKKALAKEYNIKFLEFNYKQLNNLSEKEFKILLLSKLSHLKQELRLV